MMNKIYSFKNILNMNFLLRTTRQIVFSTFLCLCALSTQYAFSQKTYTISAGGDWATAANWSGGTLPTTTDSVIIAAGQNIQITTDTARCRKLNIIGAGTSQGKVTVNAGAVLIVYADNAASLAGPTNAALILLGGMLENNGVTNVTGKQSLDAIRFDNPTSGTLSSTYMGTGTLTCSTSSSTGGGGSGNTGTSITFAQTSGTATFTLSPTGVYNFLTQIIAATGTKSAMYCQKGNARINGTGTLTVSGARRSIRIIPAAGETAHLTIETGVTLNLSSTITNTTLIGVILLDNSAANVSANMTNKGTINIGGTGLNGIYMNNAAAATTTTNFTNEGTININGAFTEASSAGGIYMAGAMNMFGNVFTNSGTINFNTTADGTSAKPLFFCSSSPKNLVTNNGTITVGTNGVLPTAFRLGDAETILNNAGTITINAGNVLGIIGTGTIGSASFNNNITGILNMNLAPTSLAFVDSVRFSNVGILRGSGIFNNWGGNALDAPSSVSPSQGTAGIGMFTFNNDTSMALNGTYNVNIIGKTTAGTDFDQIVAPNATVDMSDLAITATVNYTPSVGDTIVLVNAARSTGTPRFTLPARWEGSVSGGRVQIVYVGTVNVREITAGTVNIYPNPTTDKINIALSDNDLIESATITLYDLLGKQIVIQKMTTNTCDLDISNLVQGTYFVKIDTKKGIHTEKIIKQ